MRARFRATVVALALGLVLALPVIAADHSYTHRYVVFGRVVDGSGLPIANVTVQLGVSEGFRPEGPCLDQPGSETDAFGPTRTRMTTDEHGEFIVCMHVHTLARNATEELYLAVPALDASQIVAVDPELRQSFVVIEALQGHGAWPEERSHTVVGRVWRANASPVLVENILVFGKTVDRVPVTVRLPGFDPVETTTNNYGDFAVRVPTNGTPIDGTFAEVVAENTTFQAPIGKRAGISYVPARLPALEATPTPPGGGGTMPLPPTPTPADTATDAAPTPASTPTQGPEAAETPAPWTLGLALALGLALLTRRRHST